MNMSSAGQKKKKAVGPRQAVHSESPAFLRGAISIFILFHLIAITCWAAPTSFWLVAEIKGLVRPYMLWSGLFQSWDTFAPNPPTANSYVKAAVVTQDHHIHVWAFPRMEELSYSERYFKERYRKFSEVMFNRTMPPYCLTLRSILRGRSTAKLTLRKKYYWCNTRRISSLERTKRTN